MRLEGLKVLALPYIFHFFHLEPLHDACMLPIPAIAAKRTICTLLLPFKALITFLKRLVPMLYSVSARCAQSNSILSTAMTACFESIETWRIRRIRQNNSKFAKTPNFLRRTPYFVGATDVLSSIHVLNAAYVLRILYANDGRTLNNKIHYDF